MFKNNRNLLVIAVIAVVNSLGYGIIIPILYSYSRKFGLNDFENGLLFSLFSICQFISTPIIGRLSDKYGRKPLLIISLAGTAVSFFTMAFAPGWIFLFLARALDGITAGNIPVASAVISDTTETKDRSKGFGIIGAAFGFGFVFGPAISAITLRFGISIPFIIAGTVAIFAVLLIIFMLPETNTHIGEVAKGKLFDFTHLIKSIFDESVGVTLLISLLYSFAFALFIYAFQPFTVKLLHLTLTQISVIFTLIGVVGLISQSFVLPLISNRIKDKKILAASLFIMVLTFLAFFFSKNYQLFLVFLIINAFANSFVAPMIQTLLSKEMDLKSQGSILGLNASYISVGMIFGPIIGGAVATLYLPLPFLLGSITFLLCTYLSVKVLKKPIVSERAF